LYTSIAGRSSTGIVTGWVGFGGCVACVVSDGWLGWVVGSVDGGSLLGAVVGAGVGSADGLVDGFGTLAPTVEGPVDGFSDAFGVLAPAGFSSALLSWPRVPNSTSSPATIATTAATATKEDSTCP
jgi:hypothetical protein